MSRIVFDVDELVLAGFAPIDRVRLQAGLSHELERLLAARGVPPPLLKSGEIARVEGQPMRLESGAPAWQVGRSIARAVFSGLQAPQDRSHV